LREGQVGAYFEAAAATITCGEGSAEQGRPFPHAGQAVTGRRGPKPSRQVCPVEAGFRGEDRYLAVSPVDLHVREGRSLGVPDGTDAAGSASCLRGGDPGCRLDIGTAARLGSFLVSLCGSR